LLNPLKREEALFWLKNANMDYGLLAESFDKDTGKAKTGVGFATKQEGRFLLSDFFR
jgi:hypothetical protein